MKRLFATCSVLVPLVLGCGPSVDVASGAGEPIRLQNGQFFKGPLPTGKQGPEVTAIDSRNNIIPEGQTGKKITGNAAKGAMAVAVRFDDIGSGYWLVPVGPPDPQTQGELTWTVLADFARNARAGDHNLIFSASDSQGRFGPKKSTAVVVTPLRPDGHVVVSLTWDSEADLDLHIVAPRGNELDPKHPNTLGLDEAGAPLPGNGVLDRDSNAACRLDGYREEDVVWQDAPNPGNYIARVDMFDACGAASADFTLDIWIDNKRIFTRSGRLIALNASGGGAGAGLFVTEFHF